ncbi:MAG: ester cyclase [Chloroflexaceae bacterium]|jgi:steroid delta-isomerase-like uncharacterized protein|nr:ester cyclase [Chloroflexaceae bacterium]
MGTHISSPAAVLQRLFDEVWNGGDLHKTDTLFSDAVPARDFISSFRACFPDITHTVEETISEGERVVMRWRAHGTHQGTWVGIAPTQRVVTFTGITIALVRNGKIERHTTEWDKSALLEQLTR